MEISEFDNLSISDKGYKEEEEGNPRVLATSYLMYKIGKLAKLLNLKNTKNKGGIEMWIPQPIQHFTSCKNLIDL